MRRSGSGAYVRATGAYISVPVVDRCSRYEPTCKIFLGPEDQDVIVLGSLLYLLFQRIFHRYCNCIVYVCSYQRYPFIAACFSVSSSHVASGLPIFDRISCPQQRASLHLPTLDQHETKSHQSPPSPQKNALNPFILALLDKHFTVRAEAGAVLVLGVSRYLLVTRARMGVLSFGYAQLLHSLTLVFAYLIFAAKDVVRATTTQVESTARTEPSVKCLPQKNVPGNYQGFAQLRGWLPGRPKFSKREGHDGVVSEWMDHGQLRLAGALAGQSLLKHVLTEGDKIVLARATTLGQGCSGGSQGSCSQGGSLYEQGVYAIASGYGSLAARLLFQPLEEAARLMFSKLGVEEGSASALDVMAMPKSNGEVEDSSSGRVAEPRKKYCWDGAGGCRLRERMAILLATLLKLVLTAGLVFVCFGFHYTETLLRLLLAGRGGDRAGFATVSKVAQVLSWYCVYVLFLAANGMCEAFACAVARGSQLTGMGAGLVVSFAAFWALVGPLTSRYGTESCVCTFEHVREHVTL